MKRKISAWFVFIILLGGIGIIPYQPSAAHADTRTFCIGDPNYPSGYVIIDQFVSTECPSGMTSNAPNAYHITTPTSGMTCCMASPVPSDWVVTCQGPYNSACPSGIGPYVPNTIIIKTPTSGMAICTISRTPSGYVMSGQPFYSNCCGCATGSNCLNAFVIVSSATSYNLSIMKSGTGSGTVSSSPSGINCGSTCTAAYARGSSVTLYATPNSGNVFSGWSGGCSGMGTTCNVAMNTNITVTATFTPSYNLSIMKSGTGSGTVSSSPSGINCGSTCTAAYAGGSSVTLYATPNSGNVFSGWSGGCSGMGTTCNVAMNTNTTVTATFTRMCNLSIVKSGSGTVSSSPSGINCGSTCAKAYTCGTAVTLTAATFLGHSFSGWSGCPNPSGTRCDVTLNANTTIGATFTVLAMQAVPGSTPLITLRPTLTIVKSGRGSGTVSSQPAGTGIDCGPTCSASYFRGTQVTLAAKARLGHSFAGWTGCSRVNSANECIVDLNANTTIMATFKPPQSIPRP